MQLPSIPRAPLATSACVCALALGGCASSVQTSGFKGEEREAAQAVANLQSDTNANDQAKVCANDLSRALVERLGGTSGCEKAIKTQQAEIDPGLEVTVQSVHVTGPSSARLATASVRSVFEGKKRTSTLLLTKEGGKWKISGIQ
jgi:hypothetical protein